MAEGKKVACLLTSGYEDSEFRVPYEQLTKAGYQVDIISTEVGKALQGYKGKDSTKATKSIDDAKPEEYAALLIPGGHSPDQLRADKRFVGFVKKFDELGKPIAAVCHGPQLLMAAHLVKGRTLTAWPTIQDDLKLIGDVTVKDEALVKDKNWITSRKPDDLPVFSEALVKALEARA
jgi:protease I